jgi:hypothetical protein
MRQPFREAELFEIYRGHSATGIRGIIDPFDLKNPYRIQDIKNLDEKTKKSVKNLSWVSSSTAATNSSMVNISTNISLNLSKISNDSNHQIVESDIVEDYCFYHKSPTPLNALSSVFSKKDGPKINFLEICYNEDKKLYDEAVEVLTKFIGKKKLGLVNSIKYHVNTWGLSTNNYFADDVVPKFKALAHIDFSDTVNA